MPQREDTTPLFHATERRCQLSSLLYHALCIVVDDIDAVKDYAEHAEYKYRDRKSQLGALELLAEHYNLQNRSSRGYGNPVRFTAIGLRIAMSRVAHIRTPETSMYDFWKCGSHMMLPKQLAEWRKYSQYSQANDGMVPYGSRPTVWSDTEVHEAWKQLSFVTVSPRASPGAQELAESSTRSGLEHRVKVHQSIEVPPTSKRTLSDASMTNTKHVARAQDGGHTDEAMKSKKRPRMVSDKYKEPSVADPGFSSGSDVQHTPTAGSKKEFGFKAISNMMTSMDGHLVNFVNSLFRHFDVQHNKSQALSLDLSLPGLQELCKACWGEEWKNMIQRDRKLLANADVMQSLVSAYIHTHIFQPDGHKWIELVTRMDGRLPWSLLKAVLRPTFHDDGHSSNSAIFSMIADNDTAKLEHYHSVLMQSLPAYILDDVDTQRKALTAFSNELHDTLEPLIGQLNIAATVENETFSDWRDKLQDVTHRLIKQALMIKRVTTLNSEYTFRYIWAENGIPVDRDIMFAKAPSVADVPLVVLTNLVPGVSYQHKDQQGWKTLQPAEILEKISGD